MKSGNRQFVILDRLLLGLLFLALTLACLVPLPENLVVPGFSSFILLDYLPFSIPFEIGMFSLGLLWVRKSDNRFVGVLVPVAFSIMSVDVWQIKAPGGDFLYGGYYFASITSEVISTGHLVFQSWGTYPATFLIEGSVSRMMGLSLGLTGEVVDLLWAILFGLLGFLVVESIVGSSRLASLGAVLAILGDQVLVKPSEPIDTYGVLFFLFAIVVIQRMSKSSKFTPTAGV